MRNATQDTGVADHRFQSAASASHAWSVAHASVDVSSDDVLPDDGSDVIWPNADARADAAIA